MKDTGKPTWFMVKKINYYYGRSGNPETEVYEINFRTIDKLHSGHRGLGWGGDFQTRAEAIAAGERAGWVYVKNWGEAKELAQPILDARRAESDRIVAARAGTFEVRIAIEPTDGIRYASKVRNLWVTPEIHAVLTELLGEGDGDKVVRELGTASSYWNLPAPEE